ncbi:MAG: hypothetical protein R3A44_25835 [Caldilineaceae bacterium]
MTLDAESEFAILKNATGRPLGLPSVISPVAVISLQILANGVKGCGYNLHVSQILLYLVILFGFLWENIDHPDFHKLGYHFGLMLHAYAFHYLMIHHVIYLFQANHP